MVVRLALLLASTILAMTGPSNPAPTVMDCSSATALNTSAQGDPGHRNMISAVLILALVDGKQRSPVAYEYQTYGGREWLQFFPLPEKIAIRYKGSVYNALKVAKNMLPQAAFTGALAHISPESRFTRLKCAHSTLKSTNT